jgi:3-hydroxyisobutyrate dehydrogenase-like beta-hydroxyacid dehydrogenase
MKPAHKWKRNKMLGCVGLGLLGSALAERALKAGFTVIGYDLVSKKRAALERLGGHAVSSVREVAARCPRIVFSLMTTQQVESVVHEMGAALQHGAVLIDTTTGWPPASAELGARLRRRGVHYLDATIAGSSAEARKGQVLALVGGSSVGVRGSGEVLSCFARRWFHLGPCGAGGRMKLVFNLALGLNRAVLAEALSFARAIGVPPAVALAILQEGVAYSRVMDTKGEKMLKGDFIPQARLEQHFKDVRMILKLAGERSAKVPLSKLHARLLRELIGAGFGHLDNAAIVKAFCP